MKIMLSLVLVLSSSSVLYAEDFPDALRDGTLRAGLCIVVGCDSADALIRSRMDGRYLVQGVCTDGKKATAIRTELVAKGAAGKVSIAPSDGTHLPYIDNVVNVIVVVDQGQIRREEIMRVVAPYGAALFKENGTWVKVGKPYPTAMDDWPMFAHDLKRSNVLRDRMVKVPSGLQWLAGSPMAEYMTNQAITSGGRIFYSRSRHMKNREFDGTRGLLMARDAFNGLLLWKRELQTGHAWRRSCMAVDGDRLYVTIDEGVVALDAPTGEVLQRYEDAKGVEVSYCDGKLILGKGNMVVDATSGDVLWENKRRTYTSDCLVDANRLITTDKELIVCLDLDTGEEIWSIPLDAQVDLVCMWEDLFFATSRKLNDSTFFAFKVSDGANVWQRAGRGFSAIVSDRGWVFTGEGEQSKKNQAWVGLDPRTGVEKSRVPYGMYVKGPRCYPARATEKYFLPNFGGLFFLDPVEEEYTDSFAGRGTCRFGWLPSNGMVYQPVHTCSCYPMIRGDAAFSCGALPDLTKPAYPPELVQGPAFARPAGAVATANTDDWPTLRKDETRRGHTPTVLNENLQLRWQTPVATRVSSPVIADSRVYVAVPELHQVVALDKTSGAIAWRYTVGGTIDSPPTVAGNLVLFGSADGWAYCLDSHDGALRWRFRAAPVDRRMICHERIESLWPIPGSLLLVDNTVYVAAGRQAELNGGIFLYALEPVSGAVRWQRTVTRPDYQEHRNGWSVDSSNNRILTSDDEALQLDRHFYDLKTGEEKESVKGMNLWGGLMGFLVDNVSFDKSHKGESFKYWTYRRMAAHTKLTKQVQIWSRNKGNVLAVKDAVVFGVRQDQRLVFASSVDAESFLGKSGTPTPWLWELTMPEGTVMNSIVVAGETVLVGGYDTSGGKVWKVAAESGEQSGEIVLPARPRFDGLAVADGALFVATEDGTMLCLSGE